MRTIQVDYHNSKDGYAPVLEAVSIEYGPSFLVVTTQEDDGSFIRHTFPWVNVACTREWVSPHGESGGIDET
jgi:hypothetical protein